MSTIYVWSTKNPKEISQQAPLEWFHIQMPAAGGFDTNADQLDLTVRAAVASTQSEHGWNVYALDVDDEVISTLNAKRRELNFSRHRKYGLDCMFALKPHQYRIVNVHNAHTLESKRVQVYPFPSKAARPVINNSGVWWERLGWVLVITIVLSPLGIYLINLGRQLQKESAQALNDNFEFKPSGQQPDLTRPVRFLDQSPSLSGPASSKPARLDATLVDAQPQTLVPPARSSSVTQVSPASSSSVGQVAGSANYNQKVATSCYENDAGEPRLLIGTTITPELTDSGNVRAHQSIVLIVDVSGSMRDAQEILRSAVVKFANEQLPIGDTLTIISFGEFGQVLMAPMKKGDSGFDLALKQAVNKMVCNQSHTYITLGFDNLSPDSLVENNTQIVLLTDGKDSSPKKPTAYSIKSVIQRQLGTIVPVITYGMDNADTSLLSPLATETNGMQDFMRNQKEVDTALNALGGYLSSNRTARGRVHLFLNGQIIETLPLMSIATGVTNQQLFNVARQPGEYTVRYEFEDGVSFEQEVSVGEALEENPVILAKQFKSELATLTSVSMNESGLSERLTELQTKVAAAQQKHGLVAELVEIQDSIQSTLTAIARRDQASLNTLVTSFLPSYTGNYSVQPSPASVQPPAASGPVSVTSKSIFAGSTSRPPMAPEDRNNHIIR
jgi:hypothetical protein